ncbi:MAG: hypothetical protein K2X93_20090 [Candidatus Obscuribacterales bacterium]|nr:hypothetical protein [Candidatus Obscuribacterales bacterium]
MSVALPTPAAENSTMHDLEKQAISYYHELLQSSPELLTKTKDDVWRKLNEVQFIFGGRMLSPYLRPHFIARSDFNRVSSVCEEIWGAVLKVGDLAIASRELQDYLGLTADERRLIATDPKFKGVSRLSRFDSFLTDEALSFVELNAETPAGVAYADVASEIFLQLDVMKEFQQKFRVSRLDGLKHLLEVLLSAHKEFSANGKRPQIAIVDYKGLPTQREFELVQAYFEKEGYKTIIADPRELEYESGRLSKDGFEIDLVYKRLLVNEFLEKEQECSNLLKAYESQSVCMVNSFRGKLVHKKLLFGLLTDERFHDFFTKREHELISAHVPWTRRVEERKTEYKGKKVDLLEFTRENRDMLVLKPNDEYGGKGIFIGWQASESEWDQSIEIALAGDYLVQERVNTSRQVFPHITDNGDVEFIQQLIDLDPLLYDGKVGSAFTRLSATELANVTAGGGMVPVFIVEEQY